MAELVVVRAAGDEPRVVRLWKDEGKVVLVCSAEDGAEEAVRRGELIPIGFRREDVFRYEAGAPMDWNRLPHY
jgi:hypothetical protein